MAITRLDFGTAANNDGELIRTAFPKLDANDADLDSRVSTLESVGVPDLADHVAAADPHPTYLNTTRGDARYYTQTQIDNLATGTSVLSFGATGDGVTNDTSALSSAFASGGLVYVPPGTYLSDPITITSKVHIVMAPGAILKRNSATDGAHDYLVRFSTGSDGSVLQGGIIDGNKATLAASYTDYIYQWPGLNVTSADNITIKNVVFQNHVNWAMWIGGGDGHIVEDIYIHDCGKAVLFQYTNDSTLRDIFCENISNDGTAMYQHAFEIRNIYCCVIENLRINGYTPDALGADPYPIAYAFERVFSSSISNLYLAGYDGTETRNYGTQIANAENCTFMGLDFDNAFWGIEFDTAVDCALSGFRVNGAFKTHGSSDGYGLGFKSSGVYQNDGAVVAYDNRANTASQNVTISNGSISGCEVGVGIFGGNNLHFTNVIANANLYYGFQAREMVTNSWYPGQPVQRVENIMLHNCQARFNGLCGTFFGAGNRFSILGGAYCDNGWDTSLGATFRSGILLNEETSRSLDEVNIIGAFCGDTQTFTKTDGASFNPGSTDADDQFTITLIDPDQVSLGQYLKFTNATGSGDVTARVVARNMDDITVQCSGATTFSATGNLTAGTGTISSSSSTLTGSGTAFLTELVGSAWIKASDGSFYHVQKVVSNTSAVIIPAPSPALSGATFEILTVDVVGIPSQQYGIASNANANGPLSIVNVSTNGAVTAATSFSTTATLGSANLINSGGLFANGSNVLLNGKTAKTNIVNLFGTTLTPYFQTQASSQAGGSFLLSGDINSGNGPAMIMAKGRLAGAVVQSGDNCGALTWLGSDGTNYIPASGIVCYIDATPGTNDMPGRMVFYTTPDGSAAPLERMRLDSSGNIVLGAAALNTTATDGFLYIPTCAGTPTGTPTAKTGRVPMIYDTTNNKFYIYNGGWKGGTTPGAFS